MGSQARYFSHAVGHAPGFAVEEIPRGYSPQSCIDRVKMPAVVIS